MTGLDLVDWFYAVETAANDHGEVGDWEAQDFFLEWFTDLRYAMMAAEGRARALHESADSSNGGRS
jgi:hypothetical protein